jgi:hypothetical protein
MYRACARNPEGHVSLSTYKGGNFMKAINKTWLLLGALGLVLVVSPASRAQTNSNNATVNLNAKLSESLTVVAGPATVNFTPLAANGPTAGDNPVTITTTWALLKTRGTVKLYAYFASGNALTDGGGDNIPVANVTGSVNGGAATAFTGAQPFGGATGLLVFSQTLSGAGAWNSSHGPDTIGMTINTAGLALPAATYTGVLNVQAQAL